MKKIFLNIIRKLNKILIYTNLNFIRFFKSKKNKLKNYSFFKQKRVKIFISKNM